MLIYIYTFIFSDMALLMARLVCLSCFSTLGSRNINFWMACNIMYRHLFCRCYLPLIFTRKHHKNSTKVFLHQHWGTSSLELFFSQSVHIFHYSTDKRVPVTQQDMHKTASFWFMQDLRCQHNHMQMFYEEGNFLDLKDTHEVFGNVNIAFVCLQENSTWLC